ncbi:ABC transporter ATP-binding protein [Liquorilactobacillus satsumensis]|uniref:ABC transporter ATP-binding protein n=1 Tax=Liquorilactobacillus satsumensis DSM 16230 = JCM 12392 TaxID=1423801 RepID=A0A0R1V7G7_9LACO|nr:ATP-binding cassette domain-containing protein [Liquorilactobacillus satsumensis]KRL97803.1 ABC transporter ATP-binding protein [Liquorilactobacillus satsumensis DSM 16230 = JCM 12392]MCP9313552.1 ATP-binding cassette domain-containing protein [Liquorilactobacillus satsumensis]MCP9360682.1 ATP-binding cassette domain-containing protein [Liquorilactobacillus satsumensis]
MVQNKPLLSLKEVVAYVNPNTPAQTALLNQLNLEIFEGDFITVIGPNGAGKSTLFNTIAGSIPVGSGQLLHHGRNIAKENVVKRSQFISRVFQDPKMGTAPRMTVAENLNLAAKRGDSRTLKLRGLKKKRQLFKKLTASMNNGLADKLDVATENLSGGQRQALSFLMAIIKRPELLLLDEHTAALDPKTSAQLMEQTNRNITEQKLTCLMITHRMDDALKYGNRLVVLDKGKITFDVSGEQKKKLTKEDLLALFSEIE